MVPIYYNSSYVGAAHSFDTTRKAGWIAKSLEDDPIDGIEFVETLTLRILRFHHGIAPMSERTVVPGKQLGRCLADLADAEGVDESLESDPAP